jgi:ketosteroid isomerase-like protein
VARPDYYGNPAGLVDEIEVVRGLYEAFGRRDLDAMLAALREDAELFLAGTAQLSGRSGPYLGHDGLREYFADVERLWDELVLHDLDYRAVPGSVIVMGHITGRREGVDVRRACVWTWTVAGGHATSVKAADLGDVAEA